MTPAYDAESGTVTVEMNLSIEAVLGFNSLQAGNQIGQLSQPTTAERSFNDILRLRPGETVVVGGISYDSIGRNRAAPVGLRDTDLAHRTLTVSRTSMFIVLRPSVAVLGAPGERSAPADLLLQESPAMPLLAEPGSPASVRTAPGTPAPTKPAAKKAEGPTKPEAGKKDASSEKPALVTKPAAAIRPERSPVSDDYIELKTDR